MMQPKLLLRRRSASLLLFGCTSICLFFLVSMLCYADWGAVAVIFVRGISHSYRVEILFVGERSTTPNGVS